MDLTTLESFLTLARIGHMTRAAAELHLTQPAVSAQLQKLEEQLGYRLFDRTPKGMVLTRAGEVWRQHVEESLAKLEDGKRALSELAGLERGSLAIGGGATATTYLLPSLLGRFHNLYPSIQLFVREQGSQSVLASVISGELELGIVTLPVALPSSNAAHLHIEEWVEDELRLIVPKSHALDGARSFRWEQLDGEALVLFEAGSAVRRILDGSMAEAQIRTEIVMELRSIESIKQMVRQGIGAAFVSRFALSEPERGLVCKDGPLSRQLGLIWRTDRTMSTASRTFLDMCLEQRG
jgi:LysR family cyn operon transcriptional activator